MAQSGAIFPLAEDRNVDVPAIESELRRLLAGSRPDEADSAVVRVCTLNLVAVAQDARTAARASEAGPAVTARYPCRVIVAAGDRSAADGLEASISAYCHSGGAEKPICCERISLYAGGADVERLPSVVTPLLAADVPVFVWFPGDPHVESTVYRRMLGIADRVIFDLQTIPEPNRFLPELVALSGRRPHATDLAWRRTAGWRERVATLFDAPASRSCIPALREAEIGYVPGGGGWPQAQSALLAAWICDRLAWKPAKVEQDQETWTLSATSPAGADAFIRMLPERCGGIAPGEITAIRFPDCQDGPGAFTLQRTGSGELVEARVNRQDAAPLVWNRPVEGIDMAALLGQELERPRGSASFERAAALISRVLE